MKDVSELNSIDTLLSSVRAPIQTGRWSSTELKQFKPIKDELAIGYANNVALRGTRIIIPSSLVQRVIQIVHEGRQRLARRKALFREHVWFPDMDQAVEAELDKCLACQVTWHPHPPIQFSPLPSDAWDKLKIDFYGP